MKYLIVPVTMLFMAFSINASNEIAASISYQEMNTLEFLYGFVKYPDLGIQYNHDITGHSSWGISGHFWMDQGTGVDKNFFARYYGLSFLLGYDIPFSSFIEIKNQISTGVTVLHYSWKEDIYDNNMPPSVIGTADSIKFGPAWSFSFSVAPRLAVGKILIYIPNLEFLYCVPLGKRIELPTAYSIIKTGLTFKVGFAIGFVFGENQKEN